MSVAAASFHMTIGAGSSGACSEGNSSNEAARRRRYKKGPDGDAPARYLVDDRNLSGAKRLDRHTGWWRRQERGDNRIAHLADRV